MELNKKYLNTLRCKFFLGPKCGAFDFVLEESLFMLFRWGLEMAIPLVYLKSLYAHTFFDLFSIPQVYAKIKHINLQILNLIKLKLNNKINVEHFIPLIKGEFLRK